MKYLVIFSILFSSSSFAAWKVKRLYNYTKKRSKVIVIEHVKNLKIRKKVLLKNIPEFLSETPIKKKDKIHYQEILFPQSKYQLKEVKKYNKKLLGNNKLPVDETEVKTLVSQGPDRNRIVLTILGDGYTQSEKAKFFKDAQRMTDDLFKVDTFSSYLPLFNVYAVFVPSKDSGITDTTRKNTAFDLYRSPRGSKRGILPGDRNAIEKALRLAPAPADYPIIMANDDFYGGLGGRYAITTRSLTSGSMVLRHELGHNFGNVGEEYDGGQVYSGANFTPRNSKPKWAHWASGKITPHRALFLGGDYIWQPLKNNKYERTYKFPEGNHHLFLEMSSVGWESLQDVNVKVNGKKVEYKGLFTKDRSFFRYGLKFYKEREVTVTVEDPNGDGDDVLAFMNVYAYPDTYDFKKNNVQAFANYNYNGRFVGYRPTDRTCLMKDMRSPKFCAIDLENMWHEFFKRVKIIDSLEIEGDQVVLRTPNLKGVEINWYFNGKELSQLKNKKSFKAKEQGEYKAKVRFRTPQVRKYDKKFAAEKTIQI